MRRVDARTVDLTERETLAVEEFNRHLANGHGIPFAAKLALNRYGFNRSKDVEFIAYLSDDTCDRWGGKVRVKPEWRGVEPSRPSAALSSSAIHERLVRMGVEVKR